MSGAGAVAAAGAAALVIAADLRQPAAAEEVVAQAAARFGRIEMKLHGARRLTIKAWPQLKTAGGSVIFTSGNSALEPKPGFATVATINAAIVAMAKAFAAQGLLDGVQVNSILPGPVMTHRRVTFLEKWSVANHLLCYRQPKEKGIFQQILCGLSFRA